MGRKTNYTPSPGVPPAELARLAAIVEVLSGLKTVSEAARSLDLSRNHFQTILHRGVEALVASIEAKPAGRKPKPVTVLALEREVARLSRENAKLKQRVGSTERLLDAASGLLKGRIRSRRRRKATRGQGRDGKVDSDPEPARRQQLLEVDAMCAQGLSAPLAAAVVGVHPATVRRWRARQLQSPPHPRPSRPRVGPEAAAKASAIVRQLQGLIGAEALRRSIEGLSRRQAAWVKARVLTELERERKAGLTRVQVTVPGVLRGMDGVHLRSAEGPCWALVSADGAVPYRTSVTAGRHYDAELVARALSRDIERHGAPIVYRMDRAKAHDAPQAQAVLDAHQVLVLHGPPRCPRFYGQLERQNREHRAWDATLSRLREEELEPALRAMLKSLNTLWPRRMLGWRTAAEVWSARPRLTIDRQTLREEVMERAARIASQLKHRGQPADMAERLAIEQALELRGYLRMEIGGWC